MTLEVSVSALLGFFLVLSRVTGMVLLTPVFSTTQLPMRIRAFIGIALALVITPLQMADLPEIRAGLLGLAPLLAGEILVGLMLGLGIRLVFTGVQLTGQIIGHMSGMQIADVFDPNSSSNIPIYSQLLDLFCIAFFLAIGGHRNVLRALLTSFQDLPIGGSRMERGVIEELEVLIGASFHLGVQIGAPIIVSLLLATLILGFVARTLPQLNVFQVGFNLNSFIVFLVLVFSIGAIAGLFEGHLDWTLERLEQMPFARRGEITSLE
jgi:flagellar biosynthetic protein FliR